MQKNRFDPKVHPPYCRSVTLTLPGGPLTDTHVLAQYASHLLNKIPGLSTTYHKAGVGLDALELPTTGQHLGRFASVTLIAEVVVKVSADRPQLMATLDELNVRFGRVAVRTTLAGGRAPWQAQ